MKRLLLLLPLLAACGTPQEQCIARVTRDLRVVDRLIAETETNINRGYAMEEVTVWRMEWVVCAPPPPPPKPGMKPPPPRMCMDREPDTVLRPKAIDIAEESRKLKQLKDKRAQLSRDATPLIEQCRIAYPET